MDTFLKQNIILIVNNAKIFKDIVIYDWIVLLIIILCLFFFIILKVDEFKKTINNLFPLLNIFIISYIIDLSIKLSFLIMK